MVENDRTQPDNWDLYEENRKRNEEIHREFLSTYSARAFEYGVLVIKNTTIISGGAVIALPALVKLSPGLPSDVAAKAGICFAATLLLSVIATYFVHLNWSLNYSVRELWHARDHARIARAFLPSISSEFGDDEEFKKKIDRKNRFVKITFFLPHIFAVLGLSVFFVGCAILYVGVHREWFF